MANAFKCDRCGNFYTHNGELGTHNICIEDPNGRPHMYDVCWRCAGDFDRFIGGAELVEGFEEDEEE